MVVVVVVVDLWAVFDGTVVVVVDDTDPEAALVVAGWSWASAITVTTTKRVSSYEACGAASRIESFGCSLKSMQEELEKVALVM